MQIHENQEIIYSGKDIGSEDYAMIMIHGRGATASDIMGLEQHISQKEKIAFIAPQAADYSWYPYRFIVPLEDNEPHLSSALGTIDSIVKILLEKGKPKEKIFLLGFSQGACLALEYVFRNPGNYAAVFGLSGGLIGPPGMQREISDNFKNTPVFLGCSEFDPHIPKQSVIETEKIFKEMSADVTMKFYPGMHHNINQDEVDIINSIIESRIGQKNNII